MRVRYGRRGGEVSAVQGKIAAIILAGGASKRLGEPKQLVQLDGETLLDRAVRVAREAGCVPVLVVLGAEAERVRAGCTLKGAEVLVNQSWSEGLASSIRAGLGAVGDGERSKDGVSGVLLLTCDQPAVTAGHLRSLAATGEVTASEYAGRRGVPAYFPTEWFGRLAELRGDVGARELVRGTRAIELERGELDIDSPETLAEAKRRYESPRGRME